MKKSYNFSEIVTFTRDNSLHLTENTLLNLRLVNTNFFKKINHLIPWQEIVEQSISSVSLQAKEEELRGKSKVEITYIYNNIYYEYFKQNLQKIYDIQSALGLKKTKFLQLFKKKHLNPEEKISEIDAIKEALCLGYDVILSKYEKQKPGFLALSKFISYGDYAAYYYGGLYSNNQLTSKYFIEILKAIVDNNDTHSLTVILRSITITDSESRKQRVNQFISVLFKEALVNGARPEVLDQFIQFGVPEGITFEHFTLAYNHNTVAFKFFINNDNESFKQITKRFYFDCLQDDSAEKMQALLEFVPSLANFNKLFHTCIQRGKIDIFNMLLMQKDFDSSFIDDRGRNFVHIAFVENYAQICHMDLTANTYYLSRSKEYLKFQVINELLESNKFDINAIDQDGRTYLHHAVIQNLPKIVAILISKGININQVDIINQQTALHYAASLPDSSDIINLLTNAGADIALKNNKQQTAVHLCAISSNLKFLINLLSKQADFSQPDIDENSPLKLAKIAIKDEKDPTKLSNYQEIILTLENQLALKSKVNTQPSISLDEFNALKNMVNTLKETVDSLRTQIYDQAREINLLKSDNDALNEKISALSHEKGSLELTHNVPKNPKRYSYF